MGGRNKVWPRILFWISGIFVAYCILGMLIANPLGGLILGPLLFWGWITTMRLIAFGFIEGEELTLEQFSENLQERGIDPAATKSRPSSRALPDATPDGAEAPGRTLPGPGDSMLRVRDGDGDRSGHHRGSEDRDFADFLRSGPF